MLKNLFIWVNMQKYTTTNHTTKAYLRFSNWPHLHLVQRPIEVAGDVDVPRGFRNAFDGAWNDSSSKKIK